MVEYGVRFNYCLAGYESKLAEIVVIEEKGAQLHVES
jgi:hypothetical protein